MNHNLTPADRSINAKAKMANIFDHFVYLLELHENNAVVVYSPILSSQILHSFAANAFNVFQRGLHQLEIIRLCALWDTADIETECLPTVIRLIDSNDVINLLAEETRSYWANFGSSYTGPTVSHEQAAQIRTEMRNADEIFGEEESRKAKAELRQIITACDALAMSPELRNIRNLRNKHLAHSLSMTRAEKKIGPIDPMKYGDELFILEETCPIFEKLYKWVNGKSFSINNLRKIKRKNAEALWNRCTFNIL